MKNMNHLNMTAWTAVIAYGGQWPITHIFVPAIIAIYVNNIWKLLSIIYLFESFEFIVSELPGLDYWSEATNADTLVSDIVMGLLGFSVVKILEFKVPQKVSCFAFLSPQNIKASWYASFAPYLHVLLAAMSSSVGVFGYSYGFLPYNSPWEFISFTVLYSLVSLAFGFNELVAFTFFNMVIISIICSYLAHTAVVAVVTVIISTSAIYCYRRYRQRIFQTKYVDVPTTYPKVDIVSIK